MVAYREGDMLKSDNNSTVLKDVSNSRPHILRFEKFYNVGLFFVYRCFGRFESVSRGIKILSSTRTKTDESYISLLLPEAEAILLKYDYILPRITNEKYNDYLKLVGAGAGINKNLTTHVARHTYATYLLNRNIPIETVSRCMGHSNIKMTQVYARMLGKKVVDDMQVLLK